MKLKHLSILCLTILTISCQKVKNEKQIVKTPLSDSVTEINAKKQSEKEDPDFPLKNNLAKIDKELSITYDSLSKDYNGSSAEKFLPMFEKQLQKDLKSKLTYHHKLDSLSKRISIIRTNGINFYSFDDMTGGSMRYQETYIQYKVPDGNIQVKKVDDEGLVTNAYPIKVNRVNYLLVISRSESSNSSGSANLRVFLLKGNKLIQTGDLFPRDNFEVKNAYLKKDNSLNGIMTDKVFRIYKYGEVVTYDMERLRFNTKTNIVSYDAFAFGKNGIYKTGKRIAWEFKKK